MEAVEYLHAEQPSFVILDNGRMASEQSCILMEKGKFYGMGYVPRDVAVSDSEMLKDWLTQYRRTSSSRTRCAPMPARMPAGCRRSRPLFPASFSEPMPLHIQRPLSTTTGRKTKPYRVGGGRIAGNRPVNISQDRYAQQDMQPADDLSFCRCFHVRACLLHVKAINQPRKLYGK